MDKEPKKKDVEVLEQEKLQVIIPECCLKGWDSCKHVVGKPKKVKHNVGL